MIFTEICGIIKKERNINNVVLSGGVFQNSILLEQMISLTLVIKVAKRHSF